MSFEVILGQDEALARLTSALANGRLAHALLLAGPEGVGKRMAALEVAKALLCPNGPAKACGACPSCHRVQRGIHPDLFVVEPEPGRTGISIGQVRELSRRVAQSPLEGRRKAALIDPADSMQPAAQNALLKTLEEPPQDTTLILVARDSDLLLPTVRSRCRRVDFKPVSGRVIADFLIGRGTPADTAEVLSRMAGGSFARALQLLAGSRVEDRQRLICLVASQEPPDWKDLAECISPGASGGSSRAAKGSPRERREGTASLLEMLHMLLADCLRVKTGAGIVANFDIENAVKALAGRLTFDELSKLEKVVADGIILLSFNADARLVAGRIATAFSPGRRPVGSS
ncbi:MAG: DNA polymerase III subunit delta' [Planctomycetes bacterium]|nr:DNA polymerase III subunit delta' [Planctomycetota bacterium]